MNNRIEQTIDEIENLIENSNYARFSKENIIVNKEDLEGLVQELRERTPEEVKKYQRILNNRDAIIAEAKEQAAKIINAAQIQTAELVNEHEIMQRAYAQANDMIDKATVQAQQILDDATTQANEVRFGAVKYTDEMLDKLQYIIEVSIRDNKAQHDSLINNLENVLSVVNNNRKELSSAMTAEEDAPVEDGADMTQDASDADENQTDAGEEINNYYVE